MSLIEGYVAEMAGALRGPRAVKADMLAEARDGLRDATTAYQKSGLDEPDAQRRAIADFGAVPEVVPDYQVELGVSQARRTAVLIVVALAAQPVAWHVLTRLFGDHGAPGRAYLIVDEIVRWAGGSAIGCALLAFVALGAGTRYLGTRPIFTRAIGIFAFIVCVVFALLGVLLTIFSPAADSLLALPGIPSTTALLGLPLMGVGAAAWKCLTAASAVRPRRSRGAARLR